MPSTARKEGCRGEYWQWAQTQLLTEASESNYVKRNELCDTFGECVASLDTPVQGGREIWVCKVVNSTNPKSEFSAQWTLIKKWIAIFDKVSIDPLTLSKVRNVSVKLMAVAQKHLYGGVSEDESNILVKSLLMTGTEPDWCAFVVHLRERNLKRRSVARVPCRSSFHWCSFTTAQLGRPKQVALPLDALYWDQKSGALGSQQFGKEKLCSQLACPTLFLWSSKK